MKTATLAIGAAAILVGYMVLTKRRCTSAATSTTVDGAEAIEVVETCRTPLDLILGRGGPKRPEPGAFDWIQRAVSAPLGWLGGGGGGGDELAAGEPSGSFFGDWLDQLKSGWSSSEEGTGPITRPSQVDSLAGPLEPQYRS